MYGIFCPDGRKGKFRSFDLPRAYETRAEAQKAVDANSELCEGRWVEELPDLKASPLLATPHQAVVLDADVVVTTSGKLLKSRFPDIRVVVIKD